MENKKPLSVHVNFYYYDKNNEQKYCVVKKVQSFQISNNLAKYFSTKENINSFIRRNEIANVISLKNLDRKYDQNEAKVELQVLEDEINEMKVEFVKELQKQGYSFVTAGHPHEVLNKDKFNKKKEEKDIED